MNNKKPTAGQKPQNDAPVNHNNQPQPPAESDTGAQPDVDSKDQSRHDLAESSGSAAPQTERLVQIAEEGCELFHDPTLVPYARMENGVSLRVESQPFRRWLQREFRQESKRAANPTSLSAAINEIAATALWEGGELPVSIRLGADGGNVAFDLGRDDGCAVTVTANGWSVGKPPIAFERKPHAQGMVSPVSGNLDPISQLLNVPSEEDLQLIVGWALMALNPNGAKPILIVQGEQGSGKSTMCEALKFLLDPTKPLLRSLPTSERDLAISAAANWVLAFDNVSFLSRDLSDAFCRLSTGAGLTARTHYSNDEETVFEHRRPIILNGLDAIATRQDLLSRSIVVRLPEIPAAQRLPEDVFWSRFEAARPAILGALLDATSRAIADQAKVNLPELPRMADFATWVSAGEPSLGWKPGSFLEALEQNNAESLKTSLEGSLLAAKIIDALNDDVQLEGTPTHVFGVLSLRVGPEERRNKSWPNNAQAMGRQLTLIKAAMAQVGVFIEQGTVGRGKNKERWLTITDASTSATTKASS
jgi:energy-coupling factor transporter ATP-binding protein EcfA2